MAATWSVGITAAAGTDLAHSLFVYLFAINKRYKNYICITLAYFLTLARIGKVPRLLHPVGLGIVSKIPS